MPGSGRGHLAAGLTAPGPAGAANITAGPGGSLCVWLSGSLAGRYPSSGMRAPAGLPLAAPPLLAGGEAHATPAFPPYCACGPAGLSTIAPSANAAAHVRSCIEHGRAALPGRTPPV